MEQTEKFERAEGKNFGSKYAQKGFRI